MSKPYGPLQTKQLDVCIKNHVHTKCWGEPWGLLIWANALGISMLWPACFANNSEKCLVAPVSPPSSSPSSFSSVLFCLLMSTSLLLSCHVFCYHRRDKWETREEESLGARVLTSSPPPLSLPALPLNPPSLRLPEWQLAASRVQPACQPKRIYLPTDLRKYTFECEWLMHAAALCLQMMQFFILSLSSFFLDTYAGHYYFPCYPQAFVVTKTCEEHIYKKPLNET